MLRARVNPATTRETSGNFTSGEGEAADGIGTSTGEGAEGATELTADASRFTSAVPEADAAEVVRNPMTTGAESSGAETTSAVETTGEGTEMTAMGGEATTTTSTGGEVAGEVGTEMTEIGAGGAEAATTEAVSAGTETATAAGETAAVAGETAAAGEAAGTVATAADIGGEIALAGGGGANPIADAVGAAVLVGGLIYGGIELWGGHHHDDANRAKKAGNKSEQETATAGNENMTKLSQNSHLGVTGGVEKVRNSFSGSSGTF